MLGKSLRTIQKYESGEIEVSIAMLNEIAKVLGCESTYLIGYDAERKPLENLSDIMNFLFQLDKIKELGFNIEVKRPPHYDGWECAITFNGKDVSTELNQDLCLFLEEFEDKRNEVRDYQTSLESYQKWQDKTLAYYAIKKIVGHSGAMTLTEKVYTHLDMQVLVDAINKTLENEDSITSDIKSA